MEELSDKVISIIKQLSYFDWTYELTDYYSLKYKCDIRKSIIKTDIIRLNVEELIELDNWVNTYLSKNKFTMWVIDSIRIRKQVYNLLTMSA